MVVMKNLNFKYAITSAILSLILLFPVFGFRLKNNGANIEIESDLFFLFLFVLFVFFIQLFKLALLKKIDIRKTNNPNYQSTFLFFIKKNYHLMIIFLIIGACIWPFFASRSAIDIAIMTLIYITLGSSLNIVVGFAGLLNLGFVGFYAIGAYTYALLSHWFAWTFWQALPVSGLMSSFFGLLIGFPVLRLRGDYLAVITLGFAEIIRLLLVNLDDYTLGPDGIPNLPKPGFFESKIEFISSFKTCNIIFQEIDKWFRNSQNMTIYLYLTIFFLVLATLFFSNRLMRMPVGRAWEALREDEIACRSLGLNPASIKLSAFTSAALFAGFGGAFFAARQGSVSPESFTFLESTMVLAMVVLGGMGSQVGVILAAIFLTIIPEIAREFAEYRLLIFGLLMVLTMKYCPQGFFPMKRRHVKLKGNTK